MPTEQSQGESTLTVVIAFCANFRYRRREVDRRGHDRFRFVGGGSRTLVGRHRQPGAAAHRRQTQPTTRHPTAKGPGGTAGKRTSGPCWPRSASSWPVGSCRSTTASRSSRRSRSTPITRWATSCWRWPSASKGCRSDRRSAVRVGKLGTLDRDLLDHARARDLRPDAEGGPCRGRGRTCRHRRRYRWHCTPPVDRRSRVRRCRSWRSGCCSASWH